jgi:hypothetical protein
MQLPQALCRALPSLAIIAGLLASGGRAGAANESTNTSASAKTRTGRLIVSPSSLRFGEVGVGRQKVQTAAITNVGDSEIRLLQVTTQGRDFDVTGLDLPLRLASGASFTFSVTFAPQSRGDSSGSILFFSDVSDIPGPILSTGMTGTGVKAHEVVVRPATMNFGTVQVGSSAHQRGTLIAADERVTVFSAVSSSPEFHIAGLSFPFTIGPRDQARFTIGFTPRASGAVSATLTFRDLSGNSLLTIESLKGEGAVSQAHTVDLSWDASSSKNVTGYNVYRGNTSGGPYRKINHVLNASTVYTDASVLDGHTYYYVTTSVNSKKKESRYSRQTRAAIP